MSLSLSDVKCNDGVTMLRQVRVHTNLTVRDITTVLGKVSQEDHSNCDALAVVVLSHGNEGILYGYDGQYPAHRLWDQFTADRSPTLINKETATSNAVRTIFAELSFLLLLLQSIK